MHRRSGGGNVGDMTTPPRLIPLLEQFDLACDRLVRRIAGPEFDSGDDLVRTIVPMSDDEYRWEPVPGCLNIRRRADGPGPGFKRLVGAGDWARDSLWGLAPLPDPLPMGTIAWRLNHIAEMLARRADYTIGSHSLTPHDYVIPGSAAAGVDAFRTATAAWRAALTSSDDGALDQVGRSQYPDGSDPEQPFLELVWWVNQEVLHHGAEIMLLRDLYRAGHGAS
jgi:hypothetical protein